MSRYSQKDDNFRCLAKKALVKEKFYTPAPGTKLPTATCQQEFHQPQATAASMRCWACQRFQWIPERCITQRKWLSRKRWVTTWINDHYDMCFFRFVCDRPVMRQNASSDWIITGAARVQLPELPWIILFRHFVSIKRSWTLGFWQGDWSTCYVSAASTKVRSSVFQWLVLWDFKTWMFDWGLPWIWI